MKPRTLSLALAMVLIPSLFASAQVGSVQLSSSPANPAPGQAITITAKSYSTDLNSSNISWSAGGRVVQKGVGLVSYSTKAPSAGKVLVVDVSAVSQNGLEFSGEISISSGSIDLIVEPQGYVPAMFPGKVPVAFQNSVKITAIPHLANSSGTEYKPSDMVYQWENNDTVMESDSGYGRQSVIIKGGIIPRPYEVMVTASTRDGSRQTKALVDVSASSPSVYFYRNDPLYGPLYNLSVGNSVYLGSQKETSVVAVPFGFNTTNAGADSLSYKWLINDKLHDELSNSRVVTLRAPDGQGGASNIELDISSPTDILQSANAVFQAVFSTPNTNPNGASF